MANPSQGSIESQVQKLEQRAKIAEQTLFSRNAEVQAVQKKLDDIHLRIDRETDRLLTEQAKTISDAKASLSGGIEEQNAVLTSIVQNIADLHISRHHAENELEQVTHDLQVAKDALKTVQSQFAVQVKSAERLADDIIHLKTAKSDLELDVSRLTGEESGLEEEISALEVRLDEQKRADTEATAVYEAEITKRKEQVRLLDTQLLSRTQEIEAFRGEEAQTRDRLANWEHELQGRDQNLRIREQKVEQGEQKILSNANLLNL